MADGVTAPRPIRCQQYGYQTGRMPTVIPDYPGTRPPRKTPVFEQDERRKKAVKQAELDTWWAYLSKNPGRGHAGMA